MILKIPKLWFIIVRLTKPKKGYQDLVYQGNLLLYIINHSSIMRNLLIFKAMKIFYPKVKAISVIIALFDSPFK